MIIQVIFESKIAENEFLNHSLKDVLIFFQSFNNSFVLSNISMFESIAIQIDKIIQAIEARVITIQRSFTINAIKIV